MKDGRKKITEEIFALVKLVLKGGASSATTAETIGIAVSTVCRIRKAETYEKYLEMVRFAGGARYKNPNAEAPVEDLKQPGGTLSGNYQLNRIYEQQKETNAYLKLISEKLAYIVEQLS